MLNSAALNLAPLNTAFLPLGEADSPVSVVFQQGAIGSRALNAGAIGSPLRYEVSGGGETPVFNGSINTGPINSFGIGGGLAGSASEEETPVEGERYIGYISDHLAAGSTAGLSITTSLQSHTVALSAAPVFGCAAILRSSFAAAEALLASILDGDNTFRLREALGLSEAFTGVPTSLLFSGVALQGTTTAVLEGNAYLQQQFSVSDSAYFIARALQSDTALFADALRPLINRVLVMATSLQAQDSQYAQLSLTAQLDEGFIAEDQLGFVARLIAASNLVAHDAFLRDPQTLCRMAETVHLADLSSLKREIVARLLDDFDFATAVLYIARLTLGEDLTLADLLHADALAGDGITRIARMAETITLISRNAATLELVASLAETLALWTSFDNRYTLTAQSQLDAVDSFLARFLGVLAQLDTLQLVDQLAGALVFVAKSADNVMFADIEHATLTTLLRNQDVLAFVGRLPLDDGDYQAWVLNSDSLGVTEYTQFPFNSLADTGRGAFGLTDTGLYELTGDDDDGTPIEAVLRTGDLTFNTSEFKRVDSAYLYLISTDDVYLKTISTHRGQRSEIWYRVNYREGADDGQTRRVRFGRGVKGTTWAFELTNVAGGDFDLRGAEVLPMKLARRI